MLGKASEIKTCLIEEIEKEAEWELFKEAHPNAVIIDIKYAPVFGNDSFWYTALIIYKEESA